MWKFKDIDKRLFSMNKKLDKRLSSMDKKLSSIDVAEAQNHQNLRNSGWYFWTTPTEIVISYNVK